MAVVKPPDEIFLDILGLILGPKADPSKARGKGVAVLNAWRKSIEIEVRKTIAREIQQKGL